MGHYVSVTNNNILKYIEDYDVLVCSMKPSRIKAKQLAILELFFVLSRIGCIYITNGPLGDIKGVVSFFVDKKGIDLLKDALKTVGYCDKFYLLDFFSRSNGSSKDLVSINEMVWKRVPFSVSKYYEHDRRLYEEHSSHNREFYIYGTDRTVKKVKGYRGDGSDTGRRALPVEDTRLMINLAAIGSGMVLFDPFAGSGGILYEARYIDPSLVIISADIDAKLEPGLQTYADIHYTMDARSVELSGTKIDAIVTEVPFSTDVTRNVVEAFVHLSQFLQDNARVVIMCAENQNHELRQCMESLHFTLFTEKPVNRKGTDVKITVWYRSKEQVNRLMDLHQAVSSIH